MELHGSETERKLWEAFAGESKAAIRYTFYAAQARKDGYEQIAGIFQETADNERSHAKLWLRALGEINSTGMNLLAAANGEQQEWQEMYPEMAAVARREGFQELARQFEVVAAVEKAHEARYRRLKENLEQGQIFCRQEEMIWLCRNCGHLASGASAPAVCPVCGHPQAYFEIQAENY